MSDFFKPVDYVIPDSPALPESAPYVWDKEALKGAHTMILDEVEKIRHGNSVFSTYAIDAGKFNIPSLHAVELFVEHPSDKAFLGIRDICRQDFGGRAGDYFHRLLQVCREEVQNHG